MAIFGVNQDKKEAKKYEKQQKKRLREDESIRNSKLRRVRHENLEKSLGIGRIIFFILLFAVFMRSLAGYGNDVTFFGFLEYLSTAPQINPDFAVIPQITVNAPSWLEWGKDLINFIVTFINVTGYLTKGLTNFVLMASWGLMYIFG